MTTQNIIEAIKKIRKAKVLKQAEMAEKLNISIQQYNKYETGKSEMTLSTFLKILNILETNPKEFFGFEEGKITLNSEEIEAIENFILKLKRKGL